MQNRKRDTDVHNRLLDSVGEGEGWMFWENSIETSILSRVKQITSPGWMHETSGQRAGALGRPRGMGWGGRREGGLGWGTHVNPWLIHVNVWQNPLQYYKVINLQLIKKKEDSQNVSENKIRTWSLPFISLYSLEGFSVVPNVSPARTIWEYKLSFHCYSKWKESV